MAAIKHQITEWALGTGVISPPLAELSSLRIFLVTCLLYLSIYYVGKYRFSFYMGLSFECRLQNGRLSSETHQKDILKARRLKSRSSFDTRLFVIAMKAPDMHFFYYF